MKDQLIPHIRVDLYHASWTKNDFTYLKSFLHDGANPHIAEGHGQGKGFYLWTRKELALHQVDFKREFHNDSKGYPLILKFNEELNTTHFDLDYECNQNLISAFIFGHWEIFKKIPDNAIKTSRGFLTVSKCRRIQDFFGGNHRMVFCLDNKNTVCKLVKDDESSNTHDSAFFGPIFDYLQKHFPSETQHFESQAFLKLAKKGIGIKYVGNSHLRVHSFEMEVNGRWLDEPASRKYIGSLGIHL